MLLVVYVLLFIGFKSFSDPSDGTHSFQLRSITATLTPRTAIAGIVNTCLAVGAAVAVNRSERSSGDEASAREEEAAKSISDKVKDVLDMVAGQIKTGLKLIETMQRLKADGGDL